MVGLRIKESGEDSIPTIVPADSCLMTTQDDGLPEVEKKKDLQPEDAEVVGPGLVAHNQAVATKATILEVNEDTISDQVVRDLILDRLVEDISSDPRSSEIG